MFRNPTTDLIVVLVIVLLIFGPKRLPGLGRQLGQGLREFKDSITGDSDESEETERPAIARSSAAPVPGPSEATPSEATPGVPAREPADAAPPTTPERASAEIGSERSS
jgi:sec-independent protein translocase protein TatA